MRKATSFAAMLMLVSASGCSLLVDTSSYVGGGGADAGTDGAVQQDGAVVQQDGAVVQDGGQEDGSVEDDRPTTPEIRITPEAPRTTDALRVEIVTESEDPLGAGPVTYEYAWQLDDEETAHAGETVPASETRKGQSWSVTVVAVSADGERRSEPATSSVIIQNTPPTVMTVGLSRYRPVEGETLVATPGLTHDADGDGLVFRYAWRKNGEIIAGQATSQLDLGSVGAEPGDRIEVELTVNDREEDSTPVSAGPAIVLEEVTRWRQLLPERMGTFRAFDPVHRRVLLGSPELDEEGNKRLGIWEYSLDSERFVKLFPEGEAPPYGPILLSSDEDVFELVTYDAPNQRLLVFGIPHNLEVERREEFSTVFALDLRRRGAERWSVITDGQEGPFLLLPGAFTRAVHDVARQRVLVYGNLDLIEGDEWFPELVIRSELWALDLSNPEQARWSRVEMPPLPEPIAFPLFVMDAERDRALLIGGVRWNFQGELTFLYSMYSLSLANPEAGFALEEVVLPRIVGIAHHWIEGGRLHIFSGPRPGDAGTFGEEGAFYEDILTMDLESFEFSSRPIVGNLDENLPLLDMGGAFLARDPGSSRLIMTGASQVDFNATDFRLLALDPSTGELTPLHRTGIDLPGPLTHAVAVRQASNAFMMYGGIDRQGKVRDELWRFEREGWTRMNPMPDSETGRRPGPRAGVVVDSGDALWLVSGVSSGEELADTTVWRLDEDRWVERILDTGESQLAARQGAMLFSPGCGALVGMVGGYARYTAFDDALGFSCQSGGTQCAWSELVADAGSEAPSARAYGAAARFLTGLFSSGRVFLLGGETSPGFPASDMDVWSLPASSCTTRKWRREEVVEGVPLSGRAGLSMTARTTTSGLVFGGIVSDGTASNEVKELVVSSSGGVRWHEVSLPDGPDTERIIGRGHHVAIYDSRQERLLVYGGRGRYSDTSMSDLWELRWRPETD